MVQNNQSSVMNDPTGFLYMKDVKKIINSTENIRDRTLLTLLGYTGARISEILLLQKDRIVWDRNSISYVKFLHILYKYMTN